VRIGRSKTVRDDLPNVTINEHHLPNQRGPPIVGLNKKSVCNSDGANYFNAMVMTSRLPPPGSAFLPSSEVLFSIEFDSLPRLMYACFSFDQLADADAWLLILGPVCGRPNRTSPTTPPSVRMKKIVWTANRRGNCRRNSRGRVRFRAQAYEASAEQVARPPDAIEQNPRVGPFVRSSTPMFGWVIAGEAIWRSSTDSALPTAAKLRLWTTTNHVGAISNSNSIPAPGRKPIPGVCIRSGIDPHGFGDRLFEINIRAADNPFPEPAARGKRPKRRNVTPPPSNGHTMNVVLGEGRGPSRLKINDEVTSQNRRSYHSPFGKPVGLQFLRPDPFRNIRLRRDRMENLLDCGTEQWKQTKEHARRSFSPMRTAPRRRSGRTATRIKESYAIHVVSRYSMDRPKSNSEDILPLGVPGDVMRETSVQVNNETASIHPLQPTDCGPGAIFRAKTRGSSTGTGKR